MSSIGLAGQVIGRYKLYQVDTINSKSLENRIGKLVVQISYDMSIVKNGCFSSHVSKNQDPRLLRRTQ
jgi:hypothetical protein